VERRGLDIEESVRRLARPELAAQGAPLAAWTQRLIDELGSSESDDTTVLAFRLPAGEV
jgi:hypothetical protein